MKRIGEIADEAFAIFGAGRQVASYASRYPGFDLSQAYQVAERVCDLRGARGETAIGRKIGFTNRAVQITYGVHGPIWNYMFDSTVRDLAAIGGRFDLSGLTEPLLEPEIVFHIAAPPRPDMAAGELLGCVDWIAHGFEIVQSIFPNWKFTAADSVAGYGLHGAYLLGPKHSVDDTPGRGRKRSPHSPWNSPAQMASKSSATRAMSWADPWKRWGIWCANSQPLRLASRCDQGSW